MSMCTNKNNGQLSYFKTKKQVVIFPDPTLLTCRSSCVECAAAEIRYCNLSSTHKIRLLTDFERKIPVVKLSDLIRTCNFVYMDAVSRKFYSSESF